MITDEIFTIDEAAEYLKLSHQTIRKLIKEGKIKCFKTGRIYRITNDSIQEFIKNITSQGMEP